MTDVVKVPVVDVPAGGTLQQFNVFSRALGTVMSKHVITEDLEHFLGITNSGLLPLKFMFPEMK